MKTRTQLINYLIKKRNYQSYLEIGVETGRNFKAIECECKIGVDPNVNSPATHHCTSDHYFANCQEKFDIIFIDGFHHQNQVEKDILNSLNHINQNGTIVVHDCNPPNELSQLVPRQSIEWCGDTWKAFAKFKNEYNLPAYVVNINYGCGIIECNAKPIKISQFNNDLTWEIFNTKKHQLLNLITISQWLMHGFEKML